MSILTAYHSTINETKEKKPGKVLTVHICKKQDVMDTINKNLHETNDVDVDFAEIYMDNDYSCDHMNIWVPVIDNEGIFIDSALDYVLSGIALERYNVKDSEGKPQDIEVIVIELPKKMWKKAPWLVTEISYKFATRFPDLTIIASIPDNVHSDKEILSIFKRK